MVNEIQMEWHLNFTAFLLHKKQYNPRNSGNIDTKYNRLIYSEWL